MRKSGSTHYISQIESLASVYKINISIKHPGSILDPLLFLTYVNNMPQAITIYSELLLYAENQ